MLRLGPEFSLALIQVSSSVSDKHLALALSDKMDKRPSHTHTLFAHILAETCGIGMSQVILKQRA